MLFTIAIFFDTSSLRDLGWTSAPLASVLELAKAGLVEVYLPELVVAERRTHWAEGPAKALLAARTALKDLASNSIITSHHAEQVRQALAEVEKLNIEEMSVAAVESFLRANRINELPMTFEQSKAAWKSYFAGKPPHRAIKNRDDIPGAHIFEAAKELLQRSGEVHFVCSDKRLAAPLKALHGARVYGTLEDLFASKVLAEPTQLWARDKKWREVAHLAPMEEIKSELRSRIAEDLDEELHNLDFTSEKIPVAGAVAHINWALGGELIEIENPDDWGGGHMTFEVGCECLAGIRIGLSHEDARGLPGWIEVEWGHGSAIYATAQVRLRVETSVDVEIDLLNVERNTRPLLGSVSFNDPQLHIIETDAQF